MTDTELVNEAKEIIANDCGCHRECENEDYCGCEDEARQIIDLVRKNDNPLA